MNNCIVLQTLKFILTVAAGFKKNRKLVILIYHRVLDAPDFMLSDEVDKVHFDWQMTLLSKYFNVLPLREALGRMESGCLPPRAVCITFDDGYADNYTNAFPILKRFNLSATFFIANGFLEGGRMWNDTVIESIRNVKQDELDLTAMELGRYDISDNQKKSAVALDIIKKIRHLPMSQRSEFTNFIASKSHDLPDDLMMTTEQIKDLFQNGMEIGGHTVNHPILAMLPSKLAEQEIIENKHFLENLIGEKIRYFAYPNGQPNKDYLVEHVRMIKDAGYEAAVSTHWEAARYSDDRWQLPRFTPWDSSVVKFMLRVLYKYLIVKNIKVASYE